MYDNYVIMKVYALAIIATLVFCEQSHAQIKLVRNYLAGTRLNIAQKDFIKYDAASGYYLVSDGDTWEQPGASLFLTPDLEVVKSMEMNVKIQSTHLPRLRNGKGVNIGDTTTRIKNKVGWNPDQSTYKGQLIYFYKKRFLLSIPMPTGQQKRLYQYSAYYYFHNGRLQAICYSLDDPAYMT